jgi:DNA mismatch repair protein MutS
MIYDEYANYLQKYKKEFGDNTIVLFECGSFFEIYDDGSGETDMKGISEILNIVVSRRNKAIVEVSQANFEMAGFPSHALKKFVNILLSNNYTVVLVKQVTPPPNPQRKVTEILSPGVCLDITSADTNNLMTIYIEENERYGASGYDVAIGCSIIDVTTGKTYVYEATNHKKDQSYCYDEIHRLIAMYNPKEVELMSEVLPSITLNSLTDYIDFGGAYVHNKLGQQFLKCVKLSYQKELLGSVFQGHGLLDVLEFLDLERLPLATVAFSRSVQFAHMHNETLITKLKKPQVLCHQNTLLISYNAVQQLDIYNKGKGKNDNLVNMLNNSKTAIGKRYFKYRFLHPHIDLSVFENDYKKLEAMTIEDAEQVRVKLSNVYDIERLFRKCYLGVLQPHELYNVYTSLLCLMDIHRIKFKFDFIQVVPSSTYTRIFEFIKIMESIFNVQNLQLYNADSLEANVFTEGTKSELDELQQQLNDCISIFEEFVAKVSNNVDGLIKLDYSDRDGYVLSTTTKRYQELIVKSKLELSIGKGQHHVIWKDITTKAMTNSVKIYHPLFENINTKVIALKSRLYKACELEYKRILQHIGNTYEDFFDGCIKCIEYVDFLTTRKYNIHVYRLKKPELHQTSNTPSFVIAKGLRHLIIEKMQNGIQYISNDIHIGTNLPHVNDEENQQMGMLLYGINSSGKSSLMKAVGIAIIMAQSGMYVPCEQMYINPYHKVFTRILSCDDIFRGQSTFTKEIMELRNILKRADEHSLVIGDELCSGTESASALAIVSAGILALVKKKSSFLFATHLHDLNKIDEVTSLQEVKSYHLAVHHDATTNKLVYDRKLKPGSGSSLYGIEVCKALDMDKEFIDSANLIRQKIVGVDRDLECGTASRYNAHTYMTKCKICGARAEEVHHIHEQCTADEHGYINTFHKNSKFNLVALCDSCHKSVHNKNISINGYVQTDKGVELDFTSYKESTINDMEEEIKYIFTKESALSTKLETINTFNTLNRFKTKKEKYEYICSKYGVTKYKIDKILKSM